MSRRRKTNPMTGLEKSKGATFALRTMKISDFYRPLKKPVTIRIDADVLAWFQKDGNRYQTRINLALRKVMEKEMKVL
ncbi:MAG: BrnA antitoxin family protein [Candidatus Sulfotelmatobacter sp.]